MLGLYLRVEEIIDQPNSFPTDLSASILDSDQVERVGLLERERLLSQPPPSRKSTQPQLISGGSATEIGGGSNGCWLDVHGGRGKGGDEDGKR